jgi:DNA-binding MarR family transcriptional regulator
VNDTLVEVKVGTQDKRERHLYLTNQGHELQERLSSAQSDRMRKAFKNAGPNAVSGFKTVLEAMMDPELNKIYSKLRKEG